MQISRRGALIGASAAAVVAGVPGAVQADRPQLEYIQALVSELRNADGSTMMAVYVAFQEVADRLENLPGIVPVANEWWHTWRAEHHDKPTNLEWPIGPYLTTGRAGPWPPLSN